MKLLSIVIIAITLSSCSLMNKSAKTDDVVISMRKTECRGKCPVYKVEVFESGLLKFQGKKNVNVIGEEEKQLPKSEFKALKKAFSDADFFRFQDEYVTRVTDLPTTYISYTYKGQAKMIKDYHKAPAALKSLEAQVALLVEEWVK